MIFNLHAVVSVYLIIASMEFNCKAMILAAGRGERMRPLTDHTPKPMLKVKGRPLIAYHLKALSRAGCGSVVVNTAWLSEALQRGLTGIAVPQIKFSHEEQALETAGGIVRALPLLDEVFWVVAGDIYAPEFSFAPESVVAFKASQKLAHLWLVPNPAHNPAGDFYLGEHKYTFSTIALYRKSFFDEALTGIVAGNPHGERLALAPLLRTAIAKGDVDMTLYTGAWTDVGTPERLHELQ